MFFKVYSECVYLLRLCNDMACLLSKNLKIKYFLKKAFALKQFDMKPLFSLL